MSLKAKGRSILIAIAHRFGSRIIDSRTGQELGRAFLVPFRGKIHVIGLARPAIPIFLPQARLTYWKQEIGFTTHPKPDFPHEPSA
jgi:hypothetical protein